MERLPRFWKDPEASPDPWWAVGLSLASNACMVLYFITDRAWVYFLPLVFGIGVVCLWTWELYKQSHEGFMAGYHARGWERLQLLHRRKFRHDMDVEVDVSYSPGARAAWTTDLKSGGDAVSVTFLGKFVVPHKPNHDVAVTDVANLGIVAIDASPDAPSSSDEDNGSWRPTFASGRTVDITSCVQEARTVRNWSPVLVVDNVTKPAYATLVYTTRVKRD